MTHGGPDALGAALHDFSTNANACGPCPHALAAVERADPRRYPDPAYTALCEQLAQFHQVDPRRIVIASSASEFISRITAAVAQRGGTRIQVPPHCYGDYLRAAAAWGFEVVSDGADLVWCCDPSSPLGQPQEGLAASIGKPGAETTCVIDLAYEPLRLDGELLLSARHLDRVWQLWTPNKVLGLTGVRAAYAIAPLDSAEMTGRLTALAPSWPVGAHGVALLECWTGFETQRWVDESRATLRSWKASQREMCESLGWTCLPSVANYFCAKPDVAYSGERAAAMRAKGIKLRDTASFGLPGHVRLGVLPTASQEALRQSWR
ncbi:aminotransferase class I/II-fold pyridoxal phosphate-dependent enzyme [Variovorax sp. Sphag1AA]|uniref:aminotransferase class I/II-fold pyridoxal phosphate-dependent enzyme n=1 Tax=Variovorax sp. Sphag1AA TaxID=2587027 RepID=UPI0017A479A0|nr:histidinol-phosphate aminotransferase [Variovorax sp. Sphag1AA]